MSRPLKAMPYAQARVIEEDEGSALVSYYTIVCVVDKDGWLQINGLYSMTTRRHISAFMQELGLSYQLAKQLYQDGLKYNLKTGEVA